MRVIIVSPGGENFGGGMGTVAKNIKNHLETENAVSVRVVDSRGEINFIASFYFLAKSLAQVFIELCVRKDQIILHINVSERASFYRKSCFILLAKTFNAPTILHHHGAEFIQFYSTTNRLSKCIAKYCISNTCENIVLGHKWKLFIEENIENHSPISIMYNAVPERSHLQKQPSTHFTICMIANLSDRKGVSIALKALVLLKKEIAFEMHFVGGGEVNRFTAEAAKLGLSDCCTFHGWVQGSRVLEIMINSNLLILPSYEEGFPMVILEAMAHKVPVICTSVGSIGEVLETEKHCLFIDVGSELSLFNSILRLYSSNKLCLTLTTNAKSLYLENYSFKKYMKSLIMKYAKCLSNNSKRN